ncbi:MaoC family dehydratase N-terminal domain-containing protein [Parvibaculum sp.]|uniref:MaoC family dehydratase N-terminal domain-containing protein n=1 Tax=Parvibaculum sp. TaxID=2024848 RepID=UPI002B66A5A5|nr:MaoC family dehydratase N-terminal domain-containing protein [Parvibaculum sp.]HUD51640.1 MaoC family dehydratase N-terminal domain-containing protein [Parvibaculum sp.]
MIDRKFIGYEFAPAIAEVEKGRLRFFAKATGNADPIYFDEEAARAAGYKSLPVPPTFFFCLEMERDNPMDFLELLGVDLGRVLHGEQSFVYHAPVCAGDHVTFRSRISDIYDKKGGALEFIVMETEGRNQDGLHVVDMRRSIVVRNA